MVGGHTVIRSPAVACCVLNVKVLVGTLYQEKGPSRGILHDCENFAEGSFEALEDTAGHSTKSDHRVTVHHRLLPRL